MAQINLLENVRNVVEHFLGNFAKSMKYQMKVGCMKIYGRTLRQDFSQDFRKSFSDTSVNCRQIIDDLYPNQRIKILGYTFPYKFFSKPEKSQQTYIDYCIRGPILLFLTTV